MYSIIPSYPISFILIRYAGLVGPDAIPPAPEEGFRFPKSIFRRRKGEVRVKAAAFTRYLSRLVGRKGFFARSNIPVYDGCVLWQESK